MTITVEQLLKHNSDNSAKIQIQFAEQSLHQNNPQANSQDNLNSGDQNTEGHNDSSSEPSTPGLDIDSFFKESATPRHNI